MMGTLVPKSEISSLKPSSMVVKPDLFVWAWVDALTPRSTAEVMSGRSVSLSSLFLGKPP